MIEKILSARNLTDASKEVIRNKGVAGVDKMNVRQLTTYLSEYRSELVEKVHSGNYHALPILGKEIPKSNGKKRLLGIPTVIDRMLQQAVSRVLITRYEYMFSIYSYGFRPQHNQHQAVSKSLNYINSGYQYIVEIDLERYFDEPSHYNNIDTHTDDYNS